MRLNQVQETYALKRHNKQEIHEAAAGATWHAISQHTFI